MWDFALRNQNSKKGRLTAKLYHIFATTFSYEFQKFAAELLT